MAVGSDGTAYIVYDNGNIYPGPQGIGLATCNSDGCSTSTIATGISPRDFTAAAIAIGSDGNPVIAYSDVSFSSNGSYTASGGHYYQNGTDTVVSSDVSFPDLSIGPDGLAQVYFQNSAYWDSGATPGANFVKCGNVSCSSSVVNPISLSGATPYSYGSIAVAADGNARLEVDLGSWPDSDYYVECTANDCSTYDSSLTSGDLNSAAGIVSLVSDQNGIARMTFEDYDTGVIYQVRPTISAVISQNTSGTVSSDDAAASTYQTAAGTTNLGMITVFGQTQAGCTAGIETVGTISPSTYTGNVIIRRTVLNKGLYENSTDAGSDYASHDDTPDPKFQDQDPQSGGSAGKVYDLDAPGVQPPDSNTYRIRENFYVYATLADGTTRISPNYYFYIRMSCTKTSGIPGYQFVNDISGDNQIGTGSTTTSWNLQ